MPLHMLSCFLLRYPPNMSSPPVPQTRLCFFNKYKSNEKKRLVPQGWYLHTAPTCAMLAWPHADAGPTPLAVSFPVY